MSSFLSIRFAGTIFRALRNRNYRLYFAGQLLSMMGSWIATIAASWLVFRLTHSSFLLGLTGFAGQIPAFLLSPIAGAQVDRIDRRTLLVITQTLSMLQSFILAAMTLSGHITVEWIVLLSAVQGIIMAYDMPARQAFVSELVEDRSDLSNAIALNSAMFNSARLVGPSVGGILIAATSEGICFLVNAISYLAVIGCLLLMTTPRREIKHSDMRLFGHIKEGVAYAFHFKPLRELLILLGLVSLLGTSYSILLPVIVDEVFHSGPRTLGILMSASGLGALTGALILASRKSVRGLGKVIASASSALGIVLCIFAYVHVMWISTTLLFTAGLSFILTAASINTVIQTIVDDDKRGRVMSIYAMAFTGMMPLGSLICGALADRMGVSGVIALTGILSIMAALRFTWQLPEIRKGASPVYLEKGV